MAEEISHITTAQSHKYTRQEQYSNNLAMKWNSHGYLENILLHKKKNEVPLIKNTMKMLRNMQIQKKKKKNPPLTKEEINTKKRYIALNELYCTVLYCSER